MVAVDMIIRCFADDLAGFVDDNFRALPPMQRSRSCQCCSIYRTSCPSPAFQCTMITGASAFGQVVKDFVRL